MTAATPILDVRFLVEGVCPPKGNHQAFPIARGKCNQCRPGQRCRTRNCFGGTIVGAIITDKGGDELEAWQALVGIRAKSARNLACQRMVMRPGAIELTLIFVFARPAGHWTDSGALTSVGRAQLLPTVKPDFDKVTRAATDGITGALAEDDALVIVAPIAKVYAGWKGWTGVAVRARQIASYPAWVVDELAYHGVWSPPAAAQGALL